MGKPITHLTCLAGPTTGRKITAGQRTMSGLNVDLTGQTLFLLVIFGCEHFIIFTIQLSLNAVCSIRLLWFLFSSAFFFRCFALKPLKKKNAEKNFMSSSVVMKRNKAKQEQTELWSNATMQQVILSVISNMTFFWKTYSNDNLLSVRKLKDS